MSSDTASNDPGTEFLRLLKAGVNAFDASAFGLLNQTGQVDAADVYEEIRRQVDFLGVKVVQGLQASDAAKVAGAPSVSALLQGRMRLSPSEANARVRAAKALCESRSLTGEPIPAPLPQVAEAAEAGTISTEHVDVITRTMDDLPDGLDPDIRDSVENTMVQNALQFGPKPLRRIGRRLALHLNPKDPDPEKNNARRRLTFLDDLPGLVRISGRCTAEAAATIQGALDPLAKPRPEVEGIKDLRTYPQRQIDALEELAAQALRQGNLPSQGGERPHVSIGLTPQEAKAGVVHLPWVGPVALNTVEWMLCDAAITFIEIDENGIPTRISKPQRTVPAWLRRSTFERDKGCAFPGCDRPIGWSDIHHAVPWEAKKEHHIDNLVTLCGFHHKLVHQQKWKIEFIARIPHFIAPKWIDIDQIPRRNHVHHTQRNQPLRT